MYPVYFINRHHQLTPQRRQWHPLQSSCPENPMDRGAWWAAVHGVAKSQTRLSDFIFTFHFHALEKEMATHSSVLAWRIPGTGEPGGLPSMGQHRVGHDWRDLVAAAAAATYSCLLHSLHTRCRLGWSGLFSSKSFLLCPLPSLSWCHIFWDHQLWPLCRSRFYPLYIPPCLWRLPCINHPEWPYPPQHLSHLPEPFPVSTVTSTWWLSRTHRILGLSHLISLPQSSVLAFHRQLQPGDSVLHGLPPQCYAWSSVSSSVSQNSGTRGLNIPPLLWRPHPLPLQHPFQVSSYLPQAMTLPQEKKQKLSRIWLGGL